jgi:agmatine deiminase
MKPTPTPPYRMPAEWEPHAGTWLAWPHKLSDWPGKFAPVPWVYGEIVRTLARYETVHLIVPEPGTKARKLAEDVLTKVGADRSRVVFHTFPTNRSWVRDSGPIFVHDANRTVVALDWRFNAWAKYDDWQTDDKVPGLAAKSVRKPIIQPKHAGRRVVLEGGGIDVNGAGLILTTEEWLLSDVQVRNAGFTRTDYEQVFAEYLGAPKTLWLNLGIVGDDTHGHVDDLARFTDARTVVTVVESDPNDENYTRLQENLDRLRGFTDAAGKKLTVVPLPMPRPLVFRGQRLPASYANFYIANGVVIVPTFNDPADRIALGTLADLFPDRDVIGIHSVDLVWGLGTLHCLSQQMPA